MWNWFIVLVLCQIIASTAASAGDKSAVYQKCLYGCIQDNCNQDGDAFRSGSVLKQDMFSKVLQWSCRDECSYQCMWSTVKKYASQGEVPKFHGKWPFIRIMGVQEPAAAFTSVLNLAANAYMVTKLRKEFPVKSMPIVLCWHLFAVVNMNAWVWSTVFHTRDKPFTEFMDYACALSLVMGLFLSAVIRIFFRRKVNALFLLVPLFYYATHVRYLYTGKVDYDYNMKVNVFIGAWASVLWLCWSVPQWYMGRGYALKMVLFTVASAAALSLELLDFPPMWGSWDAHALWHLATAPLPLLFFSFVIDDLRFLQAGQYNKMI